jgi:hypothetical protein
MMTILVSPVRLDGAAEFYDQALAVAPWWPERHYSRALVLAEVNELRRRSANEALSQPGSRGR